MLDMMGKRYSDLSYMMSLPFDYGMELIKHMAQEIKEETLWDVYLADLSSMNQTKPWKEWKINMQKEEGKKDSRTSAEIIAEIEEKRSRFKRG